MTILITGEIKDRLWVLPTTVVRFDVERCCLVMLISMSHAFSDGRSAIGDKDGIGGVIAEVVAAEPECANAGTGQAKWL